MIPKLSAPLVKDIRTGEGIFEWLLGVADLLAGVTGNLSISHTVLYGTIIGGVKGARRLLLKLVALQSGAGIGAPLEPQVLKGVAGTVSHTVAEALPAAESVLSEITAAEQAAVKAQAEPGLPAGQVTAGLAPTAPDTIVLGTATTHITSTGNTGASS